MNDEYNAWYTWNDVVKRQTRPTLLERLELFISPWQTVPAPKGTVCIVNDFCGRPLYRYKILNDKVFYLQPANYDDSLSTAQMR